MATEQKTLQWEVIIAIVTQLEQAGIPYQIDASTTLFVHGIDIEMDDIDIVVQWDRLQDARSLFKAYKPTAIKGKKGDWHQFHIYPQNVDVHFLTTERITDVCNNPDRVRVTHGDTSFWSLSVDWCRRHTPDDHERAPLIDRYLAERDKPQTA